jgi:RNA polymerase sigma-70 factor (ECF subfamily)
MDLSAVSSDELSKLCVDVGETDAWQEFVRRFQKPIALTVVRVSRMWGMTSPSTIDDLVQETYLRLCADRCRLLRNFTASANAEDSLAALVRVIASNVAHDYFRGRTAQKRGGVQAAMLPELPDDEVLSDVWRGVREIERDLQIAEIERVVKEAPEGEISSRERLIFRLYFRQGMTAAAIASIPPLKLTTKGVESAIFRVSRYLRLRLNPEPPGGEASQRVAEGVMPRIPIKEEGAL